MPQITSIEKPSTTSTKTRDCPHQPQLLSEQQIQELMHEAIRFVDRLRLWGLIAAASVVALAVLVYQLLR
jgi:hypothetical protein